MYTREEIDRPVAATRRALRGRWEGPEGALLLRQVLDSIRTGVPLPSGLVSSSSTLDGPLDLAGAPLDDRDFSGWKLDEVALDHASIVGANFRRASMCRAEMGAVEAAGADFREADLTRACAMTADLRDADFRGATMTHAILHGADLTGARLEGADLRDARLVGVKGADYTGANIEGADIRPTAPDPMDE